MLATFVIHHENLALLRSECQKISPDGESSQHRGRADADPHLLAFRLAREELGWRPEYDFARFLRDWRDAEVPYARENRYPVPGAPAPWQP